MESYLLDDSRFHYQRDVTDEGAKNCVVFSIVECFARILFFFFFKQKTAYEIDMSLEFRRVLFRSASCLTRTNRGLRLCATQPATPWPMRTRIWDASWESMPRWAAIWSVSPAGSSSIRLQRSTPKCWQNHVTIMVVNSAGSCACERTCDTSFMNPMVRCSSAPRASAWLSWEETSVSCSVAAADCCSSAVSLPFTRSSSCLYWVEFLSSSSTSPAIASSSLAL